MTPLALLLALAQAAHPGSPTERGCGDHAWRYVYRPERLTVLRRCVTITGTIVDATAGRSKAGLRHDPDGDAHGWIRVDSQFRAFVASANDQYQRGNLVFEIVCRWPPQHNEAATTACALDSVRLTVPPPGTRVAITGTLVEERHHAPWHEIHPVSRIRSLP